MKKNKSLDDAKEFVTRALAMGCKPSSDGNWIKWEGTMLTCDMILEAATLTRLGDAVRELTSPNAPVSHGGGTQPKEAK